MYTIQMIQQRPVEGWLKDSLSKDNQVENSDTKRWPNKQTQPATLQ